MTNFRGVVELYVQLMGVMLVFMGATEHNNPLLAILMVTIGIAIIVGTSVIPPLRKHRKEHRSSSKEQVDFDNTKR